MAPLCLRMQKLMLQLHHEGKSFCVIKSILKVSLGVISKIIKQYTEAGNLYNKLFNYVRKPKLTLCEQCALLLKLRQNPYTSSAATLFLSINFGKTVCIWTVRTYLLTFQLNKPFLSKWHRCLQLAFATATNAFGNN